jgi:D-alanyl-D-alanine dipeptidase
MPSGFDDFTEKAHRAYDTMTSKAAENCRLLEDLMVEQGFSPLPSEWWHFNWCDWEKYPLRTETFEELDSVKEARS